MAGTGLRWAWAVAAMSLWPMAAAAQTEDWAAAVAGAEYDRGSVRIVDASRAAVIFRQLSDNPDGPRRAYYEVTLDCRQEVFFISEASESRAGTFRFVNQASLVEGTPFEQAFAAICAQAFPSGVPALSDLGMGTVTLTSEPGKRGTLRPREPVFGARIELLVVGGAAEAAGLRIGDCIIGFGGDTITASEQLDRLIARSKIGSRVEIILFRAGTRMTITAVVGEAGN